MSAPENTSMARRDETAAAVRTEDQIWSGALKPHEKAAVARIADAFGLSPFLGHVQVLGGKLYIGVEGWLEIANRHPKFDGYDLEPLTREQKDAMLAGEDDVMFRAAVYRKDRRRPAVAFGRANRLNVAAELRGQKLVVEVAQARALRKALRGAFSATEMPLPDEGDGEGRAAIESGQPERDYAPFWQAVKGLGVTNEEAHRVLGVASLKEVADLRAAYKRIEAHVQAKQLARSGEISEMEMLSGAYQLGFEDQQEVLQALGVKSFGAWTRQGKTWSDALAGLQQAVAARPIAKLGQADEPMVEVEYAEGEVYDGEVPEDDEPDADGGEASSSADAGDGDPLGIDAETAVQILGAKAAEFAREGGQDGTATPGQVRGVKGVARELGLSDEDVGVVLSRAFGQPRIEALSGAQARAFLVWAGDAATAKRQARHVVMYFGGQRSLV